MTLTSSKVKNFSASRISRILKSFLVTSALFPSALSMIALANIQNLDSNCIFRLPNSIGPSSSRVEAMYSASLQSGRFDNVDLVVQHQSIPLNELVYPLKKMMKELMIVLVSPSLQVYPCSFETFCMDFEPCVTASLPNLLKCPHCLRGFALCLSSLSHEFLKSVKDPDPRVRSIFGQ